MRLKGAYPRDVRRLNEIICDAARRGVDLSGYWSQVIELARVLAEQEGNGGGLWYNEELRVGPHDKYQPDGHALEVLRSLARLPPRERAHFEAVACREIRRRAELQGGSR